MTCVSCHPAAKRVLTITRCEAPVSCRAWWHRGGTDHRAESQRFRATIADSKVKHPYNILLGDREYTAFLGRFTATFTGPLELSDGDGHRTDRQRVRGRLLNHRSSRVA
jgi:hypothetical protein